MENNINPKSVEEYFKSSNLRDFRTFYYIDLKDNKAIALANKLCAEIFQQFRKIYDFRQSRTIQTLIFPQDIYVFNENASPFYHQNYFFVNTTNIKPEKGKPIFEPGTVFINNSINSLEELNTNNDLMRDKNLFSSSHFLYNVIHEWLHATFINITKSRAFLGTYYFDKTMQNYEVQKLNDKEKELVSDVISTYPANCKNSQYSEVFAESWTKFICESLSEDCTSFIKNPLDILKSTPIEFQNLLQKISDIKLLHLFNP